MTGKERVLAVLKGEQPDRLPMGFWYHFPPETFSDEDATVKCHLDFYNAVQPDLFKIMNENIFPYEVEINEADDFFKIKPVAEDAKWIEQQVKTTKRIVEELEGEPFIFMTLHGIIASTWHARGGSDGYGEGSLLLQKFMRQNPEAMEHIFQIIADAMCLLVDKVKDTGIDAIYYSALGGESYLFTDEEYEKHIKKYDQQLFEHIMKVFPNSALHICKDKNHLERFKDLKPAIINWGENQDNPPLEDANKYWPDAAVLGGFDNTGGVLVEGDYQAIKEHLANTIERMSDYRFMVGADCTLPSDIDLKQLNNVSKALCELAE